MKLHVNMAHLRVLRVLHEDDNMMTCEISKNDDVAFTLKQNKEGETVGGDEFYFVFFMHNNKDTGEMKTWEPWNE